MPKAGSPTIPPEYKPTDKEKFMNPNMVDYFRRKLISWREELLRESSATIHDTLQTTELQQPDLTDRASAETDHALELRTRDRERKLITKINEALCFVLMTARTAIVKKPANRSAWAVWMPVQLQPCRLKRKSVTNAWNVRNGMSSFYRL